MIASFEASPSRTTLYFRQIEDDGVDSEGVFLRASDFERLSRLEEGWDWAAYAADRDLPSDFVESYGHLTTSAEGWPRWFQFRVDQVQEMKRVLAKCGIDVVQVPGEPFYG